MTSVLINILRVRKLPKLERSEYWGMMRWHALAWRDGKANPIVRRGSLASAIMWRQYLRGK